MKTKSENRSDRLVREIADQFANASTPMSGEWLSDNNVTLDECGALCDRVAMIIKGFLNSPKDTQLTILAWACADDKQLAGMIARAIHRQAAMRQLGSKKT
jgi:hypothetical protein